MIDINTNSLYKEVIMEHAKTPKNKGLDVSLPVYSIKNPVCGDNVDMQIIIENGAITKVNQVSVGCTISCASTSVVSELLVGKTVVEAKKLVAEFTKLVKGQSVDKNVDLGDAVVFSGVADYPARFKCATVSWELVLNILNKMGY